MNEISLHIKYCFIKDVPRKNKGVALFLAYVPVMLLKALVQHLLSGMFRTVTSLSPQAIDWMAFRWFHILISCNTTV